MAFRYAPPTLLLALGLGALLASGCGDAKASAVGERDPVVLVQAPRGTLGSLAAPSSFRDPYPSGTRIAVWDAERPAEPPRVLTPDFDAAGSPCVEPGGTRVLFCGKRKPNDVWRVYEVPLGGGRAVPLSPEGRNATSACYLPDGRVVFSCEDQGTIDPRDGGSAFSLYSAARDGAELARLTFNPSSDVDPTVLADGRILYAAWQPPGFGRPEGAFAFLTVRNDGTGVFAFYGSHERPRWKRRPRQVGERVVFAVSEAGGGAARLRSVAMRRPLHSLEKVAAELDVDWRSAEIWDGERLLVSQRPPETGGEPPSFGLHLLDPATGAVAPLLDDPGLEEVDAVRARPRVPARGHISQVQPEARTGELLCLDARRSEGLEPDPEPSREAARLLVYRGIPPKAGAPIPATAVGGSDSPPAVRAELIARLPLAGDGSVYFEVPADTPLRFRTVDREGAVVLDSNGWIWVRPGERRSCIGCHASREEAPANRFPAVLAVDDPRPAPLEAQEVPPR